MICKFVENFLPSFKAYCRRKDIPSRFCSWLKTAKPIQVQNYWFFFSRSLALKWLLKIYCSKKELVKSSSFEWKFYLNKISCHLMIFWWRLESERTRGKKNHKSHAPDLFHTDRFSLAVSSFQTFLYSLRIDRILWLYQIT